MIQSIPLSAIRPGENDRSQFPESDLRDLADSIQAHGLIQPITIRPIESDLTGHLFEIVAGERRFRALDLLGRLEADCIVRPMSDQDASRVMLAENLQREDIDPIDEAQAFQRRMDRFSLSFADMADWAKVSESKVRARVKLLSLIPEVQHLIRHGHMPLSYASEMTSLDKNHQIIAFRYFGQVKRPTVAEFRSLCSSLLEQQNQVSMWDMSEFMTKPIEQIVEEFGIRVPRVWRLSFFGIRITIEYMEPQWFRKAKGACL